MTKEIKVFIFMGKLYQGGERVIADLSLHLPEYVDTTFVLWEEKISYPLRGRVINLNIPLSLNPFLRVSRFFLRFWKLKKIMKEEHPDYVLSMGNSANMINILANPHAIVRVDMHPTMGNPGFWGLLYRIFILLFFHRAQWIICVSKSAAQDLIDTYHISPKKIKVIYNPLDLERIASLAQESLPPSFEDIFRFPVVMTVGRITKQKGQWHLIRAFLKIKETVKNAKLVILGVGELQDSLQKISHDLGVENDVYFLGWQANPFALLARAKIFVLPSLWEGLPTVLLEAMACGLPVISTDCKSGPREILAPDTNVKKTAANIEYAKYGVLVPLEDEDALALAISTVMQNPVLAKELGIKARKRSEDFRMQAIVKEWDFLFGASP